MFGNDRSIDSAPDVEIGRQTHEARLTDFHQFVEYAVGDSLMERALLAEGPDVQLKRFQLDTMLLRHILQGEHGEIRLSCFRAQAGKFRYADAHSVVAARVRVRESLEVLAGLYGHARTIPESL